MIRANVVESEKKVYVDVSGYVSTKDAKQFLNNYHQMVRSIKSSQYKLVVTINSFECENQADIKNACVTFLKTGYRQIYLVDPKDYVRNNMSLGNMERKIFFKSVKVVKSSFEAK